MCGNKSKGLVEKEVLPRTMEGKKDSPKRDRLVVAGKGTGAKVADPFFSKARLGRTPIMKSNFSPRTQRLGQASDKGPAAHTRAKSLERRATASTEEDVPSSVLDMSGTDAPRSNGKKVKKASQSLTKTPLSAKHSEITQSMIL